MARQPMVTRTITTTKAVVLCLNIETGEPCNEVITLPRTYKDEKSLMKKITETFGEETTVKPVHVVSKEEIETLYGMSEQNFIKYAKELPPRTVNVDETEEYTEN